MDNSTDRCGGRFRLLVTPIQDTEIQYQCKVCSETIRDSLLDYNLEQHIFHCGKKSQFAAMDNPTDRCGGKFRQLVTPMQVIEVRYKCNVCAEIINDSLLDYNLEQHFLRCGKSPCPEVLPGKEDEPSATFPERLRSARRTTLAVRQQPLGDNQIACNKADNSRTRSKTPPAVSQRLTSRQSGSRPSRKGPPGTAESQVSLENVKKSTHQKEKNSLSPTNLYCTSTNGKVYNNYFGDCTGNFHFTSPHQDAPTSPHIPVQQPPPQKCVELHGQLAVPNRPHSASIIKQVPLPKRPPIYVDFPTTRVVISGLPRLQVMEESSEVDQLLWKLKKVAETESFNTFDPLRQVNIRTYPEEDKWVVNVADEECAEAIHAWVMRHRFIGCDLRACYEQVIEVKDFN